MEGTVRIVGMSPCGAKLAEAMGFANFVEPKIGGSGGNITTESMF
jgi:hypothetical protein